MSQPGTRLFYEFSGFRLDPQQRLLTGRDDRRPIALVPKAFDTLLYLIERRGELVRKAELMKAVWPDLVVEENSLNQNISAIRRSLGERPGEHRFVVTEPGRGYRFVADVQVVPDGAETVPAAEAPAAATVPAVTAAAPASPRQSIAVLPFANLTGDPAKDYVSDGIAEELIHTFARIPGLKVPSRTSSFAYKGRNIDLRQIARDLDVGAVLEGSVRSAGDRIRVTAQLIDASNGYHLWSQHYDRELGDLFKLQDELAFSIVDTLRLKLDGHAAGMLHEPPTRQPEAYHLYLQGMSLQGRLSPYEAIPRVMEMMQRVVALDPKFERAHNAMALLRATAIALDIQLPGTLADSERDILARPAEFSQGSTHAALGVIYCAQGKWISAREQFREAFARDAADPLALQSYGMHLLGSLGLRRSYATTSLEAYRLAPVLLGTILNLAVAHVLLGEDETARHYAELATTLGVPRTAGPLMDVLAQLAVRAGRIEEAGQIVVAGLPPEVAADGGSEVVRRQFQPSELQTAAQRRSHIQALDRLCARPQPGPLSQLMKRRFVVWYTQLGALDQAFANMSQSLDHFERAGTIGTAWAFLWLPELLPLRRDPRFQQLCRRMRMFEFWEAYGPPDQCELRAGQLICQ